MVRSFKSSCQELARRSEAGAATHHRALLSSLGTFCANTRGLNEAPGARTLAITIAHDRVAASPSADGAHSIPRYLVSDLHAP